MRIGCNQFPSKSSGLELAFFVHTHVKGSEYEKGTGQSLGAVAASISLKDSVIYKHGGSE